MKAIASQEDAAPRSRTLVIVAFSQAREVLGFSDHQVEAAPDDTPRSLVLRLRPGTDLSFWRAALDLEFVSWEARIGDARELAIIPPVSGG